MNSIAHYSFSHQDCPVALAGVPISRRPVQHALKRLVDILGSAALLLLLLPIFVLAALLVYLDDGAPLIHRRRVVGPKGEFDAFKFRTMRRNADLLLANNSALLAEYQRNFKLVNDPRVTKVGSLLRKLSLDELPQLLNVFAGQMSLVGPRMITSPELEKYGPYKGFLLSCKPGLTGYWQIFGRQTVSYEERVRMDLFYLQNWSLGMDFILLLRTPFKVLNMEGAY